MAKPNPDKVPYYFAQEAVNRANHIKAVYSECVRLSYQTTGRLAPGFDNKDLIAWINKYMPDAFDEKGNKKICNLSQDCLLTSKQKVLYY